MAFMEMRKKLGVPGFTAVAVVVVAAGSVVLASVGVGPIGSTSDGASAELRGRNLVGTRLVLDGGARALGKTNAVTLTFDRSRERLSAFNGCTDLTSEYQLREGRIFLTGTANSVDMEDSLVEEGGDCAQGPRRVRSERLDTFYFANPDIEISGPNVVLRGSGIELTLSDVEAAERQ